MSLMHLFSVKISCLLLLSLANVYCTAHPVCCYKFCYWSLNPVASWVKMGRSYNFPTEENMDAQNLHKMGEYVPYRLFCIFGKTERKSSGRLEFRGYLTPRFTTTTSRIKMSYLFCCKTVVLVHKLFSGTGS